MKLGDKGDEVTKLQKSLNAHGVLCGVDGIFGPGTENAVKTFQLKSGLTPDGIVGPKTIATLAKVGDEKQEPIITTGLDERTDKFLKTLDPKAQKIFLPFILEAKRIAATMGYDYKAISGNRTWEEQNALYAQGRTKPGPIVTKARGGSSNHNFKIALDFGVLKDGVYLEEKKPGEAEKGHRAVAKIISKYGIEWGGNWKSIVDIPHFEVSTGLTMAEKRSRFLKFGSVL